MSEFSSDKLELLRKKDAYPYEWVNSYENLSIKNYQLEKLFIRQ